MKKSIVALICLVFATNYLLWALLNQPQEAPPWEGIIQGVSFTPFQPGQDPLTKKYPAFEDFDRDLQLLRGKVGAVRTYSSTNGFEQIPAVAGRYKLRVTAGAWVDRDLANNELELGNLLVNAARHKNIDRLVVGNESVLRQDLTVKELSKYLQRVRRQTSLPVSTAEPWDIWLRNPALAQEVDYILIHVLPYWEGIASDQAVDWVIEQYRRVQAAFPGRQVVIGEVGWPSAGERFGRSRPTLVNQARFIREFLHRAKSEGLEYFVIEAFDQPWKDQLEGLVGKHWGLFDIERQPKFSMTGQIVEVAIWPHAALASCLLALVPLAFFFARSKKHLFLRGRLFFAFSIQMAASIFSWFAATPLTTDLTITSCFVWAGLLPAQLLLLAVMLVNGFEMTEVLWSRGWRRLFQPIEQERPGKTWPKVSIHLPIHNEPPEMVRQTLAALAALDYPDYEVLVIDNNTTEEQVWTPVADFCLSLGPRFRFFHLADWPGYKAGALNFALAQTDRRAEIIGIVDSDYLVAPGWLRSLLPHFERPEVGFVQAPQDNRDWGATPFKEMCNWEYHGFFKIGMMHRNERNAIIQHGTMTLIRRAALAEVGGWGEWCICEDAELGLRLLAARYEAVYVNHVFGAGLTPGTFAGYKRQRFRWVYGAVQILRRHWRALAAGKRTPLTRGQQYHFWAGWLPWFADGLHLVFTMSSLLWTVGILLGPQYFELPRFEWALPLLLAFVAKYCHCLVLYKSKVPCSLKQRLGAALAGMGLTHVIGRAVLAGLFSRCQPFLRTPKAEGTPALLKGLLMAWEETQILFLLFFAASSLLVRFDLHNPDALLWTVVLLVQSLPYAGALATSMINVLPRLRMQTPAAALAVPQTSIALGPGRELRPGFAMVKTEK